LVATLQPVHRRLSLPLRAVQRHPRELKAQVAAAQKKRLNFNITINLKLMIDD
jgi:hypothetical protein